MQCCLEIDFHYAEMRLKVYLYLEAARLTFCGRKLRSFVCFALNLAVSYMEGKSHKLEAEKCSSFEIAEV